MPEPKTSNDNCSTTLAWKWVEIVKQVGFPIAVCGYLLWERQVYLNEVTLSMRDLVNKMEILVQTLK